jgi:vacuolar-type H+-ATPase subunit H
MPFTLQLKNNTIQINQGDKVSLLQMRNKALTELDDKTAESLRKLDEKELVLRYKLKLNIDEFKDSALADVKNAGISVKQSLTLEKEVAISDIATARKQGIQDIAGETIDGISEINTAGKQAKQNIAGETIDGISEINTAGKEAIQDIAGKTTDGISEIKAVGEQALQEISEAKNDIDGQKSEAISEICNLKKDVLSVIAKAGTEAKEDFLIGASAAWSDMSRQVDSRESIFKKVRRKFSKVGFLSTLRINLYNLINSVHCLCVAIPLSNSYDFCFC